MIRTTAIALCIVMILGATPSPASAQQANPNLPSREQILKLFEAIQLRRNMELSQEASMQGAMNAISEMFRQQQGANPDPQMQRQLDTIMNGVMEDVRAVLTVNEMLEAVVPIYQKHFTPEEVDAIIAFQNSDVGKKVVSLQPVMVQESIQALAPLQQRAMPELMKRLEARMKNMGTPAPEKK